MSVYNKILHERGLRLLGGIVGAAIMASAINLFIVPRASTQAALTACAR